MGSEHAASGARIVIEAKEDNSYKLDKALAEIEEARKNRDAQIGIFVFSKRSAPEDLEPFTRDGSDVVIVWDAEDSASDIILDASLSVAKAICVQDRSQSDTAGADVEEIQKAVLEIERQANGLEEIKSSAETIDKQVTRILDRARIVRNGLDRQVGILNEKVESLL